MSRVWERQIIRAGPLVKELRMIRPRASPGDTPEDRRAKEFLKKCCSLNRDATDRLELRLALMGWDAMHYCLTFNDGNLPDSYDGVLREFKNFMARCQRYRASQGKPGSFGYVRCIEGLHGNHRFHIHFVCSESDFGEADMLRLWRRGHVFTERVLKDYKAYRRLARYFRKEKQDGDKLPLDKQPLSWSKSLILPAAVCSTVKSGRVRAPKNAIVVQQPLGITNSFGAYAYIKYLIQDNSRACARASSILK